MGRQPRKQFGVTWRVVLGGGLDGDGEAQGFYLAGQAAGVFGGGAAPVEVGGQPGGGQRPVPGDQVLQDRGVQRGLPSGLRSGIRRGL